MNLSDNCRDYLLYQKYLELKGLIDSDRDKPYWGNIPISSNYLKCLYEVYKPNMKLLDLGCGAGNILRFASNIGYDVTGVEFNPELAIYLGDYKNIIKDITKLDSKFYEEFDIIYSYKPIKEDFEDYINKVVTNMKSGSYILTPRLDLDNKNLDKVSRFFMKKK